MNLKKTKTLLFFKLRRIVKSFLFGILKIKTFFIKLKKAYKILSFWEKRIIIILFIVFGVGLIFLIRDIYLKNTEPQPIIGGNISIAEIGDPKLINPLFSKSTQDRDMANLVFSGLFARNENRDLVGDIVQRWEVSEDRKTYTFYLSPEAQWHDSMPVISDDVIFTASLISDPNYSGPLKGLFENVIVEKVDDYTLRFILDEPFAPFLNNLTFGILPSHILGNLTLEDMETDEFNLFPIGCGPYKIKNTNLNAKNKQIILERDQNHFPKSSLISEINFKFYDDFDRALKAYNSGEVTMLGDIPYRYLDRIKQIRDINLYQLTPSNYMVLFFNLSNESLKDKAIREAISASINKKEIIQDVIYGSGREAIGPLLPEFDLLGYSEDVKIINFDPKSAKKTIENKDKTLEFNLVTSDDEDTLRIAELIKKQLTEVNIKIDIINSDAVTIQTDYIFPRKYDLLLFGENLGPDPDPYPFWHSSQIGAGKLNLSDFKNQEIDKLLEEARTNNDLAYRKERYEKFHKIIADEVPAVFLFQPYKYFAANNIIKDIKDSNVVTSSDKFYQISNWYIKVGRKKPKE